MYRIVFGVKGGNDKLSEFFSRKFHHSFGHPNSFCLCLSDLVSSELYFDSTGMKREGEEGGKEEHMQTHQFVLIFFFGSVLSSESSFLIYIEPISDFYLEFYVIWNKKR